MASAEVVGWEALVRWQHPVHGLVSPLDFIPIAEKSELIQEIGGWALREACRVAAGSLTGLTVSVNVSTVQLRDGEYADRVRDALLESRLDPARHALRFR